MTDPSRTGPSPTGPHRNDDTEPTMTEHQPPPDGSTAVATRRRGPDLFTLAAGLAALGVAGSALFGLDLRWVLAILAMLAGLLLVIGSLRPHRR